MEVLYPHCAGLDVHKDTVVACVRHMVNGSVRRAVRSFKTTTKELLALSDWLARAVPMSRWRRPASTGSRCGMS
jgi:transposase